MPDVRREAEEVVLLEKVLAACQTISHARDPLTWLTDPNFELGVVVGDLVSVKKPAVRISLSLDTDTPAGMGTRHHLNFQITFLVLVDLADTGRLPFRVGADIRQAMSKIEADPLLHGVLRFLGGELDMEASKLTGLAAFQFRYGGQFRWHH